MGYTDDDVMNDVMEEESIMADSPSDTIDNSRFEKYGNIMVDLETLSTSQNAVVLEISAVEFNRKTGEMGEVFDVKLELDEQFKSHREIDERTLLWWLDQSREAKNEVFNGDVKASVFYALEDFSAFVKRCDNQLYGNENDHRVVKLWGNGSTFDISILQSLYEQFWTKNNIPWKYWAVNDVRTIVDLNPEVKKNCNFEGTPHYAVDDCKHEIKYLVETLNTIQIKKKDKDNSPRYLDILLSDTIAEYDLEGFPYKDFLSQDDKDTIKLTIDLKEKKLLGWKESYGNYNLFVKAVDGGTYIVRNSDGDILYKREGYVPNHVVPPTDGYGDYIDFTIDENGSVPDWYNYEDLDFTDFENDD